MGGCCGAASGDGVHASERSFFGPGLRGAWRTALNFELFTYTHTTVSRRRGSVHSHGVYKLACVLPLSQLLEYGYFHIGMAELTRCPGLYIDLGQWIDVEALFSNNDGLTDQMMQLLEWLSEVHRSERK